MEGVTEDHVLGLTERWGEVGASVSGDYGLSYFRWGGVRLSKEWDVSGGSGGGAGVVGV